jgi:hypothetical protein
LTAAPDAPRRHRERRAALGIALLAMALTMLPYLFGWSLQGLQPSRGWFSWLGYNLDDSCVYLSWMRQAADGRFFQRNLFTTDPQAGHQFNLFFLALGRLARFTGLPLLLIYHAARILLGVAFLRAVWWLLEMLLSDSRARHAAFLLVCFSAGLGWLPGLWQPLGNAGPTDVWQPEAVTFLSLYLNPLFVVSLLLMVGVIGWMLVAERTRQARYALLAGLCGLLLGNIHTYDIVTLMAVWGGYLTAKSVAERRLDAGAWGRALIAGSLSAISSGYMFYLVRTEEVFAKRVAVETLSPAPTMYLLGYGLLVPLAIYGAIRRQTAGAQYRVALEPSARLFLVVWAVMNLAVAYLPVPFQRKMIMGLHLPLAVLAGAGLTLLLNRIQQGRSRVFALAAVTLLCSLTNLRALLRDVESFQSNRAQSQIQRPYLYAGEAKALDWLRRNAPPGAPIQPLPWIVLTPNRQVGLLDTTLAALAPGWTGHPVNAGHWGETPSFGETMGQWRNFLLPNATDESRLQLLRRTGVRYLIFSQKRPETADETTARLLLHPFRERLPAYLRPVPEASSDDAEVLEVALPAGSGSTG